MSGVRLPGCSKLAINRKNNNDVTICQHDAIVKSFWRFFVSLDKFSYCSKFHVNINPGSGASTIFFYKVWPEIRKLKIRPSEFSSMPRDWGKLEIANLARMFLIKCYWMLQNSRVLACPVSELLRLNQQGGGG